MPLKVLWTPSGFTLDSIREKRLHKITDGDTPQIIAPIRMLSIDTPEKSTTSSKVKKQEMIDLVPDAKNWIESGDSPVSEVLATYLLPKLDRPDVAENHWDQGKKATEAHENITAARLSKPGGGTRPLFVRIADQPFEKYGRLLAYTAPSYTAEERASMTREERATFNLNMIDNGWAATLMIYPSIPGELDLPLVQEKAREAVSEPRGAWVDPKTLTGYEYRMLERLVIIFKKITTGKTVKQSELFGFVGRYCADISTGLIYSPQDYCRVEPWNRLFIWKEDVRSAIRDLNLSPAPPA